MMVNYRRFVCEVVLLGAFLTLTTAAPASDCKHTHYDQRQNGTENYRVNIDGVVVAVAPLEDFISGVDIDDFAEILALGDLNLDSKPKPPQNSSPLPAVEVVQVVNNPDEKPSENKPLDKPSEENTAEQKPSDDKVQNLKSDVPPKSAEVTPLSDVNLSDEKIEKKEVSHKKQDKAKRMKNRLAAFLLPLLRKTRHH